MLRKCYKERDYSNLQTSTTIASPIYENDLTIDDAVDIDDFHICDFVITQTDSDNDSDTCNDDDPININKMCLILRNSCFLIIQISILILIGLQLYGIMQNPSYAGIVYRSLPNAVKENDGKSTNAVLDPILYNNLIDLREHMSDLNRQFEHVKEYVDDMKKWQIVMEEQLEKIAITSAKVSSSQTSRHEETVDDKIERALIRYNADKVGLVDYALKSSGGTIISTPDTYPYSKLTEFNLIGMLWFNSYSDKNLLIQPNNSPGDCFAFYGNSGKIRIKLSKRIYVTKFTIEHVNPKLVDDISSAPRGIEVYGSDDVDFLNVRKLASYVYDANNGHVQMFPIDDVNDEDRDNRRNFAYEYVELRVLSNHGNEEYTCIYRFRVHGNKSNDSNS